MTQEQIEKLPKWAQTEVTTLIIRLNEANEKLDRLNSNPESNTAIGFGYPFKDERVEFLRQNEMVTFFLPSGRIRARINKDCVDINSDNDGRTTFVVKPRASNSCELKFVAD